jgi:hypothetical protein
MPQFMKKYFHVPLDSITRTKIWLTSQFRNVRNAGSDFKDVCDSIQSESVHCSLSE